MAKYTELFSEYLERGGQLPASFALIDGFEDLFKLRFCDREIGFETETLFFMKLEAKARIYLPFYSEQIKRLAKAYLNFDAPAKTRYESTSGTADMGAQDGTTTELPFDDETAVPSMKSHSGAYQNKDSRETEHRESGYTPGEAMETIDFLNGKVQPLLDKLLGEFDRLFMQVY